MEYVYAVLLLHKQKKEINEANITSVIKASGAQVNEAQVKALVAALADVDIDEAIKAASVTVAAAPAAGTPATGGAKEEKKEAETPSAKTEEQAMEGLSALFG
jgi:large subunit ribosomal protein L12